MSRRIGMRPLRERVRRPPVLHLPLRVYLETGALPEGDDDAWWDAFVLTSPDAREELQAAWIEHRATISGDWVKQHPGTRPHGWWLFDAPRWRREDLPPRCRYFADADLQWLAEPRRRVGGKGTLLYEVMNYAPAFRFGLPVVGFVSAWDVRYYTGRARDVHGRPIGLEFRGHRFVAQAYDPHDPPRFEAQASYLERHGLLTAAERQRLQPDAFEDEAVILGDPDDAA